MKDYILRGTAGNGSVRFFAANTRQLVNHATSIHYTTAVASAALGRTLTAAAMLGATLKNDTDILTIDFRGSGPIGGVVAVTNSKSEVKGYAINPQVELAKKPNGKLDVGGAMGIGVLTITQDMGLKEPVSGQVELISGEIAEDIAYYFTVSEQTPSSVMLGVLVDRDHSIKQAGGIIIQSLPFADEDFIIAVSENMAKLPPTTAMLEDGQSIEDILSTIFAGQQMEITDTIYPTFACNCSREKTEKALISVGKAELNTILTEDKQATLHCHFCNTSYNFTENDILELMNHA